MHLRVSSTRDGNACHVSYDAILLHVRQRWAPGFQDPARALLINACTCKAWVPSEMGSLCLVNVPTEFWYWNLLSALEHVLLGFPICVHLRWPGDGLCVPVYRKTNGQQW